MYQPSPEVAATHLGHRDAMDERRVRAIIAPEKIEAFASRAGGSS